MTGHRVGLLGLVVLLLCHEQACSSTEAMGEARAQALLDHERQGWEDRTGLDGLLRLTVLPYGVDASNQTVREYWRANEAIPSAKLTLAVDWIGPTTSSLAPPLSLRLLFHHRTNPDLRADLRLPFDSQFTVNVGAGSNGQVLFQAALFQADGQLVAVTSCKATIAPLLLSDGSGDGWGDGLVGTTGGRGDGPPVAPPDELKERFAMRGAAEVWHWYFDDLSDPDKSYRQYSQATIEGFIQGVHARKEFYYGSTDTWLYEALDMFPVTGRRVLIVGSNMPIYESICLARGAALCVTLEYNKLRYEHPHIHPFTVEEWEKARSSGQACDWSTLAVANCKFDQVWSISSFEHDGLGRYGDPIDPDADLRAMIKLRGYLAPHGELVVAVPVGPDAVFWNEGRVYGRRRLPLLLQSYTLAASFGISMQQVLAEDFPWKSRLEADPSNHEAQPVFVLRHMAHTGAAGRGAGAGEGAGNSVGRAGKGGGYSGGSGGTRRALFEL